MTCPVIAGRYADIQEWLYKFVVVKIQQVECFDLTIVRQEGVLHHIRFQVCIAVTFL